MLLQAYLIDTPIGLMVAIGSTKQLYLLEFFCSVAIKRTIKRLQAWVLFTIVVEKTSFLEEVEKQVTSYFQGTLAEFSIPIKIFGTSFQKQVYAELRKIPMGEVVSYRTIAQKLGKPNTVRAIGNANRENVFLIMIPCHRVIKSDGSLGGYKAGTVRKKYLLKKEKYYGGKAVSLFWNGKKNL